MEAKTPIMLETDYPQLIEIHRRMLGEIRKLEERLLIQVLEHCLFRKPTEEDFKRCTITFIVGAVENEYFLSYDNVLIGKVSMGMNIDTHSWHVTFTPKDEYPNGSKTAHAG